MHVLQVTPYFPPTWAYGGIPRIVDGLSRALVARGVAVTVLTTDAFDGARRADVPPERDHEGVRVRTVRNLSNRLAYSQQLFLPRGVARALDGLPPIDVIHLHGHRHLLNNAALRAAPEIPYALTANGTLRRHEKKIGLKGVWDLTISGGIPRGAARCVAVSAADVGDHLRAGISAERVARIPNGLDLAEFEPLPPRGGFRRAHGLGERPLVAYLGQLSPRKGVGHLVEAFAGNPPGGAVLVIAGNDMGAADAIRGQAAGNPAVRMVGLLEGRDRLGLLADADVLVYASTAEIFGLVPWEGLLCGAPVVVADDCGCGELIAEAGAGLLVRYGDVAGLRARIDTLLRDRVVARAMVGRGRRYIHERLGFPRVADLPEAMYREICGG